MVDGEPFQGGEARDYMLEIGGGRLIEGFEEQLVGASAGETRTVKVDFPAEYHAEELRGKPAEFEVEIKDVKEKELPALDDDFASDASEFETLEELRDDIEHKLEHAQEHSIEDEFREAVVDAAAVEAQIDLPDELVTARAEEMWTRMEQALARAGRDPEAFLKSSGKTRDEMIEEAKPDAAKQLARESVLEAVAEAEQIEVSDDELLEALKGVAEREETTPEKLLEGLTGSGRDTALRHDLRNRKAVDFLAEHASPIAMEKAAAREKLWTPGKEKEPRGPGSLDARGGGAGPSLSCACGRGSGRCCGRLPRRSFRRRAGFRRRRDGTELPSSARSPRCSGGRRRGCGWLHGWRSRLSS